MTLMWVGRGVLVRAIWSTLLVVFALAGSGCQIGDMVESADPHNDFNHNVSVTYKGEELKGRNGGNRELLITADPADFLNRWQRWLESVDAVGEKVPAYVLIPWFQLSEGYVDLDADERFCLSGPIRFFDSGTLEQVWEIPAGTCLGNGGKTVIVIDE